MLDWLQQHVALGILPDWLAAAGTVLAFWVLVRENKRRNNGCSGTVRAGAC